MAQGSIASLIITLKTICLLSLLIANRFAHLSKQTNIGNICLSTESELHISRLIHTFSVHIIIIVWFVDTSITMCISWLPSIPYLILSTIHWKKKWCQFYVFGGDFLYVIHTEFVNKYGNNNSNRWKREKQHISVGLNWNCRH